jgi:hypothetical protein
VNYNGSRLPLGIAERKVVSVIPEPGVLQPRESVPLSLPKGISPEFSLWKILRSA